MLDLDYEVDADIWKEAGTRLIQIRESIIFSLKKKDFQVIHGASYISILYWKIFASRRDIGLRIHLYRSHSLECHIKLSV